MICKLVVSHPVVRIMPKSPSFSISFQFVSTIPWPKHDVKLHNYALTITMTTSGTCLWSRYPSLLTLCYSMMYLSNMIIFVGGMYKKQGGYVVSTGRKPKGLSDHEDRVQGSSQLRHPWIRRSIDALVWWRDTQICRRKICAAYLTDWQHCVRDECFVRPGDGLCQECS